MQGFISNRMPHPATDVHVVYVRLRAGRANIRARGAGCHKAQTRKLNTYAHTRGHKENTDSNSRNDESSPRSHV